MRWVIQMELWPNTGRQSTQHQACKADLSGNSGITALCKLFPMAARVMHTAEILAKFAMMETLSAMEWSFLIAHQNLRCMNSRQLQRPLKSPQLKHLPVNSLFAISNSSRISATLKALGASPATEKSLKKVVWFYLTLLPVRAPS